MKKGQNECHNSTSFQRLIEVRVKYYQILVIKLGKTLFIIQKFANWL